MRLLMAWLLLIFGLGLVVFGGDLFVRSSVGIAEWLRLPRVVVGGTLMALATSSPEVAVSITSGLRGEPGLAVGNAVGSILCNFALIAALMAVISPYRVELRDVRMPLLVLIGLCLLVLIFSIGRQVSQLEAGVLLLAGLAYFVGDLYRNLRGRGALTAVEADVVAEARHPVTTPWLSILLFGVGAVLVVGGSRLLVDNASAIAASFNISPLAIGLTIVAIGTSLPELVTAILSARKGVADLSVGNILGANVANIALVAGSAGVLSPISISDQDLYLNLPMLMAIVAVFSWLLMARRSVGRFAGSVLMTSYFAYLILVLLTAQR